MRIGPAVGDAADESPAAGDGRRKLTARPGLRRRQVHEPDITLLSSGRKKQTVAVGGELNAVRSHCRIVESDQEARCAAPDGNRPKARGSLFIATLVIDGQAI